MVVLRCKKDQHQEKSSIKREIADALAISEYEKYRIIQDRNYLSDFDKLIEISRDTNIVDE